MFTLKKWTVCKLLAVLICLIFLAEAHVMAAQQNAAQEEKWAGLYKTAKDAYFAGSFESAKGALDALIAELESVEGRDSFKGQVYLLAGASYEKLEVMELAVKYFCWAKARLGEGKTIEGLELKKLKYYGANCAALNNLFVAGVEVQGDALMTAYNRAKIAYFAAAYEPAKNILEALITELGKIEGREIFKGQVYLLSGAVYEALKFKELAVKYYCRAKGILGEGKTIEGLELKKLKYYKEKCGGATVISGASIPRRGGSFFGGVFGFLLFAAIAGGLVWYLFFSKNAPFKKKSDDGGGGGGSFTSACFNTTWRFHIYSEWSPPVGDITLTPERAPQPNEGNGWEDQVTYTLSSTGGGSLTLVRLTMDVDIGGGDNGKRHDLAWIDGTSILDQTNTFTEPCSAPGTKNTGTIYQKDSLGTFTLRHKVELSKAATHSSAIKLIKK